METYSPAEFFSLLKRHALITQEVGQVHWNGHQSLNQALDFCIELHKELPPISPFFTEYPVWMEKVFPEKFDEFGPQRKWEFICSRYLLKQIIEEYYPQLEFRDFKDFYTGLNCEYSASLTHSKGLIRVALIPNNGAIGIDSERMDRKSLKKDELWSKITTNKEQDLLSSLGYEDQKTRVTIFSAKEALYKYAYPKYQKFFGFHEAEVIEMNDKKITLKSEVLSIIGLEPQIEVSYQEAGDYIHTIIQSLY